MDTFQIENYLSSNTHTKKIFDTVVPIDKLPNVKQMKKQLLIANTDESWKNGSHWFSVFCNKKKTNVEIFDSSGLFVSQNNRYLLDFLNKNFPGKLVKFNLNAIQNPFSNLCGIYCLVYALYKSRGKSLTQFLKLFHHDNLKANDKKVIRIFKRNFKARHFRRKIGDMCFQINKNLYLCKNLSNKRK